MVNIDVLLFLIGLLLGIIIIDVIIDYATFKETQYIIKKMKWRCKKEW